jgi:arabinose-5-phosphate isomerase
MYAVAMATERTSKRKQKVSWTVVDRQAEWLVAAREAMESEAAAIMDAAHRLDGGLARAVDLILAHPGKVVVTGIGKSGHVGHKIVATLCSTGTPAVFLHPAEALHGDLGVYAPGDPTILISKSGTTVELIRLLPMLRQFDSPLIGIIGHSTSPLADQVDALLDATVRREADPNNLAPTSSAVVALALGDALASALIQARGFSPDDFARCHPGGQLGRHLLCTVRDIMHRGEAVAWVAADDPLKQVVVVMTQCPLGAACVVGPDGRLQGLITDGDLRRALQAFDDIRSLRAADIMTYSPTTVGPDTRVREALRLMEARSSQISVLPVVDPAEMRCLGLVRIHDLYQPTLAPGLKAGASA